MSGRRRLLVLWLLFAAGLAVVWLRVAWVQVVQHGDWEAESVAARNRDQDVAGRRGRIVDANGSPLAIDRAAVRLAFVPGQWASRERFRCGTCGTVAARPTEKWWGGKDRPATPPKRCTCGARREGYQRMPEEDVGPLEDALGLPPGTLAAAADERLRDTAEQVEADAVDEVLHLVRGTVRAEQRRLSGEAGRRVAMAEVLDSYRAELAGREFYLEDARRQRRNDLYGRAVPFVTFRTANGAQIDVKSLRDDAVRILELDRDGRYRGFRTEAVTERWYPRRGLIAQCVGVVTPFASGEEFRAFKRRMGDGAALPDTRIGRLGLESSWDDALRGRPGRVRATRDDDGLYSIMTVIEPPRRGDDVRLNLTVEACEKAYEALLSAATPEGFAGRGTASGAFFVMEAETGFVRAWAESPLFDPNVSLEEITTRIDDDEANDALTTRVRDAPTQGDEGPVQPRPAVTLSRVARIAVEPGSSMKLVTISTLLHSGHALPEEYHCGGSDPGLPPPKCHNHPAVNAEGATAHSCNKFCADCASDRTHRTLHLQLFPDWAARFGIGKRTGLDFPGEGRGAYPKTVSGPLLRQLSIGQSMSATPVQMARIAAAIANGSRIPVPRIAATVGGRPIEPASDAIELDPVAVTRLRNGMEACVDYGTARGRFVGPAFQGVTVRGKTGTATATGRDWLLPGEDGPQNGPWHLWFVGYSTKPGTPTIAFAMVLHDRATGAGGDDAAPAVAKFLSWWYSR